jgi:hypothetical protein
MVAGVIPPEKVDEVIDRYGEALRRELPPGLAETFLLSEPGGRMTVLTVWRGRADLEAMLDSGEEPFARRLIREAGGTPEVGIYDIVLRGEAETTD